MEFLGDCDSKGRIAKLDGLLRAVILEVAVQREAVAYTRQPVGKHRNEARISAGMRMNMRQSAATHQKHEPCREKQERQIVRQ